MNGFNVKETLTRGLGRSKLVLAKNGPEILLVVGILGGITAAVLAARVTEKARVELEEAKAQVDDIMEKTTSPDYTETDKNKEIGTVALKATLEITRLYAPAFGFGILSITSLLWSHGIMTRRQASLSAAYSLAMEGFQAYRNRVVEELGEEADMMFTKGLRVREEVDPETGKVENVLVQDDIVPSIYGVFFDAESSREYRQSQELNQFFLQSQERFANEKLRLQGHLFLNEVLDSLGLPRTPAGCVVGWLYKHDPRKNNDTYISFDIMNVYNSPNVGEFANKNPRWLLDFNVDGDIHKLI